jgi:flagellar hook assembly protein FlgD
MPAYDNTKELGQAVNRRVEVKLTGNSQTYLAKKADADAAISPELSEKSTLIKNFPNPFVDMTTLDAYIKSDVKDASISILDINGKHVKTIHLLERGNTNVNFDGQSLAKGIYMATLNTDGAKQNTLKIILQ